MLGGSCGTRVCSILGTKGEKATLAKEQQQRQEQQQQKSRQYRDSRFFRNLGSDKHLVGRKNTLGRKRKAPCRTQPLRGEAPTNHNLQDKARGGHKNITSSPLTVLEGGGGALFQEQRS